MGRDNSSTVVEDTVSPGNSGTPRFHVQWHITSRCGNRCRHCYMFNSATYDHESTHTLGLKQLLRILDDFRAFEEKWGADIGDFFITGGDPLLYKGWEKLVEKLRQRGKRVSLMGNPETLTDDRVARLADFGVRSFQMSLDGLERTHDFVRAKGSFGRTVDKLDLLASRGMQGNIMFTLFPHNARELVPLMRHLAKKTPASVFAFDVGCFVGNAADGGRKFGPREIRDVFRDYLDEKKHLQSAGCSNRWEDPI